jgi:D-aminoacyl-tRNA deacylase
MKLVIQRVANAKVVLQKSGEVIGEIDKGLFVLVGFKKGDEKKDVDLLAVKLFKLRIMGDDRGKMNLSIENVKGSCLVVSQFTLYANTKDGNRPSFIEAEEPSKAVELYKYFVKILKGCGLKVETGKFGEYMIIEAALDGPVTISLDS